jgi:sigma-B regulation protein RsbU (phosphoserine phosphatase)
MIRPRTLQQRLAFFLLLPVAVLLIGVGTAGFFFMRHVLLTNWREATILKLQRSAHQVDMKLRQPKELVQMYFSVAGTPQGATIQDWILHELRKLDGIADVRITWLGRAGKQIEAGFCEPSASVSEHEGGAHGGTTSRRCRLEVTTPRYDADTECETVILTSEFKSPQGETVGKIEVFLRFDYLIKNVGLAPGTDVFKIFLLDDCGEVIFSNATDYTGQTFEGNALEKATLEAVRSSDYGTVLGDGRPPKEVSGFYKLHEAPWTFVMVAPGRLILRSLITFRNYYVAAGAGLIVLIILLIRSTVGRTVWTIRNVSEAADRIANGDLEILVTASNGGQDELSHLIRSFNSMILQLKDRIRLKEAVGLAQEVQQSLLPQRMPIIAGLDIAGKSDYCDETGGDYFDFIESRGPGRQRLVIAIGDVVGHGLGAALLMATVRAFLRSRLSMSGDLADVITDVNDLICRDTDRTDSFLTLLIAGIDPVRREIHWVRAGHDPAVLYCPQTDSFVDLQGNGAALGIDPSFSYREYTQGRVTAGQVLVVGTDGIWESENPSNETFGKERLREIIRENHYLPASDLVAAVLKSVHEFRDGAPQTDDVTLVVAKFGG